MPFLLLVKSHALFPNSEKYVVEIRLSPESMPDPLPSPLVQMLFMNGPEQDWFPH